MRRSGVGQEGRAWMRWFLVVLYGGVGTAHLIVTDKILPIVPDWVPAPRGVVIATGLCELAGALALLLPGWRRPAGALLAAYAVCVFPANIKHALEGIPVEGLPDSWWYHGPRLALQPVLIWLALYAVHLIDWPFRSLGGHSAGRGVTRSLSRTPGASAQPDPETAGGRDDASERLRRSS